MIKLIAKKSFSIGDKEFIKGDEIQTKNFNTIIKLNEQGFIEPLTHEDLVLIKRELSKEK